MDSGYHEISGIEPAILRLHACGPDIIAMDLHSLALHLYPSAHIRNAARERPCYRVASAHDPECAPVIEIHNEGML